MSNCKMTCLLVCPCAYVNRTSRGEIRGEITCNYIRKSLVMIRFKDCYNPICFLK